MNFGKLLGAGKTFFGSGNGATYRQRKRVYLPQFNSAKNPFTAKSAETMPTPNPEIKKVSVSVSAAAKVQKFVSSPKPVRATTWAHKLNPFRAPPIAPPLTNAVQPEFSLETVKVMHNDLSDCDVEMVPVKSRPLATAKISANDAIDFFSEPVLKTF